MELYIIIGLLIIAIIFLIIILSKNSNNQDMIERIGRLETNLTKEIGEFKLNFSKDLRTDFETLDNKIEYKLNLINDRVNNQLSENFEKSKYGRLLMLRTNKLNYKNIVLEITTLNS